MQPDQLPSRFVQSDIYQLITKAYRDGNDLCMKLLIYVVQHIQIDPDYFASRYK